MALGRKIHRLHHKLCVLKVVVVATLTATTLSTTVHGLLGGC